MSTHSAPSAYRCLCGQAYDLAHQPADVSVRCTACQRELPRPNVVEPGAGASIPHHALAPDVLLEPAVVPRFGWLFATGVPDGHNAAVVPEPVTVGSSRSDSSIGGGVDARAREASPGRPRILVLCTSCVSTVDVSEAYRGDVLTCPACATEIVAPELCGAKPVESAASTPYSPDKTRSVFTRFHTTYDTAGIDPGADDAPSPSRHLLAVPIDGPASDRRAVVPHGSPADDIAAPVPEPAPIAKHIPAERLVTQGLHRIRRAIAVVAALLVVGLAIGLGMAHRQGVERRKRGPVVLDPVAHPATNVPRTTLEAKDRAKEAVVAFGLIRATSVNIGARSFLLTTDIGCDVLVVCTGTAAVRAFESIVDATRAGGEEDLMVRVTGRVARLPDETCYVAAEEFARHHGALPLERLR